MSGQVWGHCTGWRRPLVGPVWVQSTAHFSVWGYIAHFQKMGSPSWLCIVCPLPQLSPPSKGSHGMGQLWGILALSWHWDSVDDSCLGSDHRRQRSSIQAAVVQWSYCVWVLGSAHWCTQHCSTNQLKNKCFIDNNCGGSCLQNFKYVFVDNLSTPLTSDCDVYKHFVPDKESTRSSGVRVILWWSTSSILDMLTLPLSGSSVILATWSLSDKR